MPPSTFFVRVQHGIAGGFAPPQPSAIQTVIRDNSSTSLQISSVKDLKNFSTLSEVQPKSLDLGDLDVTSLVDELHSILKELPTERPPGSEDIYGFDIGIAWGSGDLEWANGGPQGCSGGFSEVQATDEQKAKFKRAVEIVDVLAGKV